MRPPLNIIYITNARIPTEKAHGLATVKMCEAFVRLGARVTLVVPWRWNPIKEDPFQYYSAERNFMIRRLPSVDFLWLGFGGRPFFLLQLFSFSCVAAVWFFFRYIFSGKYRDAAVFSHDHIPLFFVSFAPAQIFYDIHDYPIHNRFYRRVLGRMIGCAVQTRRKIDALVKDFGISREKIVYWPNGTDVFRFDIPLQKSEAREKLGLPLDKKLIVYTGQLFTGRGIETLMKTAELLPQDIAVYIVGGNKADIAKFHIPNSKFQIRFMGQRPWPEIPLWLKAADALILPHSGLSHAVGAKEVSLYYISPMKLFEYMASGRPIVASDIPSIREIVDERMVFFARPDDPRSFAAAIQKVLADPSEAARRADAARQEAKKYTWDARAGKIISFLEK